MSRRTLTSTIITSITGPFILFAVPGLAQSADNKGSDAIRPFHVNIPQKKLDDLKRRILATEWPERETVNDQSQGVQLATMQAVAKYWATEYDKYKCEEN